MRIRLEVFRVFLAATVLATTLLVSGCCCLGDRSKPPETEVVPPVGIEETDDTETFEYSRTLLSRPLTGITDDVVEVYRLVGGTPTLMAVFLWKRQGTSEGITDERWILRNGETWPLTLKAQDWLVANQGTSGYSVNTMCAAYWNQLGYAHQGEAEVHWLNYTPTYIPPPMSCNEW